MWKWIVKHKTLSTILFAFIGLGFPVLVNTFSLFEARYEVLAKPSSWLLFWGTYLSALASFAMVFITWLTLRHYHKQQLFYIKQNEHQKLQLQLDRLYSFQTCINEMECIRCMQMIKDKNYEGVNKIGQFLIRDFDEKAFAVDMSISMRPINSAQHNFHILYNRIYIEYGTFIQDIMWLNDLMRNMPEKENERIQYIKYHMNNYGPVTNPQNYICDIIAKNVSGGDIESKLGDIFATMIRGNHIGQDKETLKQIIVSYRDQEINRINNMNNYETEQDK